MKSTIFILILFFMAGCGMSGSNSKDGSSNTSSDISASTNNNGDVTLSEDSNSTDSMGQIATTDDDSVEEEPKEDDVTLPKTISMEFPEILKEDSEENNDSTDNNGNNLTKNDEKIGYQQLKEDISEIENVIKITKVNLLIVEKVMPQILERCKGMVCCTFEQKNLSFVMDNRTILSIESILDNNQSFSELNGKKILLGEIGFRRYDDAVSYKYGLTFDIESEISFRDKDKKLKTISFLKTENNDSTKESQTIKWSDNSKDVITTYLYEDNETSSNISIHYLAEDDKEVMHIYDNIDNPLEGVKENINLTLASKDDSNDSFILRANSIEELSDGEDKNITSFSSNADISEEGSLLLFSGRILSEESGSRITTTSEVLCDHNETCDVNNSNEILADIELYELNITGGNLENGSYLLLPPTIVVEGMDMIELFDESIGTFTIFEDRRQGEIHSDLYLEVLDKLTIIQIIESENDEESTEPFKVLVDEDKPILEILEYSESE